MPFVDDGLNYNLFIIVTVVNKKQELSFEVLRNIFTIPVGRARWLLRVCRESRHVLDSWIAWL